MPASIAVLGSINLDFVIRTKSLPRAGETVSSGTFFTAPGGKGGNQALAARRLGADVAMIAKVGSDPFAREALANLIEAGVDITGVSAEPQAATGAAFINLDDAGENQIAVASGANALFAPGDTPVITADWMIAQLEIDPEVIFAAAGASNAKLCINAAPVKPLPRALLERADLLVVNEIEHAAYRADLEGLDCLIALTLGARGALLQQHGETIAQASAPTVNAVDTTGAGDAFVAALTVFLAEGLAVDQALKNACLCGALATTHYGAQAASPTRAALDAFNKAQT